MANAKLAITWLGHGTFLLRSPGGVRILVDPWLAGNPSCPPRFAKPDQLGPIDLILATHGHSDHVGDLVQTARATNATVIAIFEICAWLEQKGLQHLSPMNKGGTQRFRGVGVTMVGASHSSAFIEGSSIVYLGEPAGYVLHFEDGLTAYFAGDTGLFGDMRLIAELYQPTLAFLPIGDHFTMGPREAAKACELLKVRQVVPMHFGTFPVLTGTPEQFAQLVRPLGVEVLVLKPGETTD